MQAYSANIISLVTCLVSLTRTPLAFEATDGTMASGHIASSSSSREDNELSYELLYLTSKREGGFEGAGLDRRKAW